MPHVLVLHGPNLNLLGDREPGIYGTDNLNTINERLSATGAQHGCSVDCRQSNAESELIEWVHEARHKKTDYLIINPAAFTHTSIALRDAISASEVPFVEVHLSNVHAREAFRHHSYFSAIARGVICGLGAMGYDFALQYALKDMAAIQPEQTIST